MCKSPYKGRTCSDKDCEMSDWTAWSECPCGEQGFRSRNQTILSQSSGNGIRCPNGMQVEKGHCPEKPCICTGNTYGSHCQYPECSVTPWSSWSSCFPCPKPCFHKYDKDTCPKDVLKGQVRWRWRFGGYQESTNRCDLQVFDTAPCYCGRVCYPEYFVDMGGWGVKYYMKCEYTR